MVRFGVIFIFAITLSINAFADSGGERKVRAWGEGQWAVVDIKTVTGTVMILSPVIGREIDFEERNHFAVFGGETKYNRNQNISVLKTPVSGFQSAVFLKLSESVYGVQVTYRDEVGQHHRLLPIKDNGELMNMRRYFETFAGVSETDDAYPQETDESVSFETVQPQFQSRERLSGQLVLVGGEKVRGELLPIIEARQMLIDTENGFRRIDVDAIQQVGIGGRGGKGIFQKTLQSSIYWGLMGGFTGLMSGTFYEGASAKEQMLYGAIVGATVGGVFGLLDGLLSIQPSKTFHLGSLDRSSKRSLEISPTQIRLRF
jgi:hypothetical protein